MNKSLILLTLVTVVGTNVMGCKQLSGKEPMNIVNDKMESMVNKQENGTLEIEKNDDDIEILKAHSGNELFDENFEFDGVIYKMPTSIEELSKNGWKVKDGAGEKIEAQSSNVRVSLEKNGVTIQVIAKNNTNEETITENCIITSIEVRQEYNISMMLSNGIRLGSSKKEVDLAFDGYDAEIIDGENLECYYYSQDKLKIELVLEKDNRSVSVIRFMNN